MLDPAGKIVVLGSINMDIVVGCTHLPGRGETIIADSSAEVSGGKGANQAVAAARLGADVAFIGSVGSDAFGETLLGNLKRENIDVSHVSRRAKCASGLAVVAVEDSGENSIMVVPGANGTLTAKEVSASADLIRASRTLLLQLEVPLKTVVAAIRIAHESDTRIILNPAPAPDPFPLELLDVDLICPNQSEAALILGHKVESVDTARHAVSELTRLGARNAAITLGAQGAVVGNGSSVEWIEPFAVTPIDTTAAGDAFAAALAVNWDAQTDLSDAARFACAAGAIAATRRGAQPGMPTREEVAGLVQN